MTGNAGAALKLAGASGQAATRQALIFHMLNQTPQAVAYDRASLWRLGGKPALLGVSGLTPADPRGPFAQAWRKAIAGSGLGDKPGRLSVKTGGKEAEPLAALAPDMDALWIPLPGVGAALVFERWETPFFDDEAAILTDLAAVYAIAWRARRKGRAARSRLGALCATLAIAALVAALVFIRIPLRVAAYCEVIPDAPFLVAAPAEGVIREITVEPGAAVREGDVLAVYEESVPAGELEVARQQVEAAAAELATLRTRSLSNPQLRSDAAILEARLGQERARLAAAEERWSKVRILAPMDGTVRVDDPSSWRGKPVTVGERLLWLIRPEKNHPRIWLPQSDRVDFDFSRPVRVHLDAYGGRLLTAKLTRVGTMAQPSPERDYSFPADAEWLETPDASPYLGLSGMAVLYGPKVSLGYWLTRKPVAGVRKWLGL